MNYQWYPGHMTKAIRMMKENLSLVDMIIEIVDARIVTSARNPDIAKLGKGKFKLLILNKADLADSAVTNAWINKLTTDDQSVIALNSKNLNDKKRLIALINSVVSEKIEKDKKRGIVGRPLRAMVAGIPNVGKSTFINALTGKTAAKTGNKPGVTKGKQWITLDSNFQLLDTPGILWPKFDDEKVGIDIALIGSMNDQNLDMTDLSCELIKILEKNYPAVIKEKYGITDEMIEKYEQEQYSTHASAILSCIAVARNCIKAGAQPDMDRAASILLDDFRNGRLGKISLERP